MRRLILVSMLVLCPVTLLAADIVYLDCDTNPIALGEKVIFKAVQDPNQPPFMQFEWFWKCSLVGSPPEQSLGQTNTDAVRFLCSKVHTQRMTVTGLTPLPQDTEVNDFTVVAPSHDVIASEQNPSEGEPEMLVIITYHVYCGQKKLGTEPGGHLFVRFRDRDTMIWGDPVQVGGFGTGHVLLPPEILNAKSYRNDDGVYNTLPAGHVLDHYDQQYIYLTGNCKDEEEEFLLNIRQWEDRKETDAQWKRWLIP